MIIKIRSGNYNPQNGDLEPNGNELWSGGYEELSAAALNAMNRSIELGTWYRLEDFAILLAGLKNSKDHEVLSAITIDQRGVESPWSTSIQIGENNATLMICQAVLDYARRRQTADEVWLRIE